MSKYSIKNHIRSIIRGLYILLCSTVLLFTPILSLYTSSPSPVEASDIDDLYDQLDEIEKELAKIRKDQQDLNNKIGNEEALQSSLAAQIRNLSNSIALLELDIMEKETDILLKETEIKILEEEITDARNLIESIEEDVEKLEATASDIIKTIYIDSKTNSIIDLLLLSEQSQSFFSQLQYYTALGSREQNTLEELQEEKARLEEQKQKLEDNKIEIEILAEQIRKQKEDLEKDKEQLSAQKAQKNKLYAQSQQTVASYNDLLESLSEDEKIKLAQQAKLQQELFDQIGEIHSGQYVIKGTIIGKEGQTGYAFGEHLHFTITRDGLRYWGDLSPYCAAYGCNPNPCNYLPPGVGGCGVAGSPLEWPMRGCYNLTSSWGPRCLSGHCSFHDAIDLSYCWSQKYTSDYIYATHNGWIQYGVMSDGCKYAVICENHNCNIGYKSGYFHLE
jgi:peptidoglycan hydrolase CwlO-like protein